MLENKETLWCVYCPCSHLFLSPYLSGKRNNNNKKKTGHGGEERSSFSGHLAAKSPSDGLQRAAELRPGTLMEEDRKQAARWKDTSRGTLHTWRQTGPQVEQHHTVGDVEHTFPCS